MDINEMSCADCAAGYCGKGDAENYPAFCRTTRTEEALMKEAMAEYADPLNRRISQTAARIEYDGYLQWCRVMETVEFAKRMGFKKIGIATCVGLLNETRLLTGVLRSHGFTVVGAACKAGARPKTDVGIDSECCRIGPNMCNPILQAKTLNAERTDMNIVVGLCVGHDSLFYKYSEAVTTTLIVKDRVTGHNPAAALYTLNSYYKKLNAD